MRKTLAILAALTTLGFSSAAFAAEATGSIKTVSPGMISFTDGEHFKIPATIKTKGLKVGARVTVSYSLTGKVKMATGIKPVK